LGRFAHPFVKQFHCNIKTKETKVVGGVNMDLLVDAWVVHSSRPVHLVTSIWNMLSTVVFRWVSMSPTLLIFQVGATFFYPSKNKQLY
jgi:hypothetical protein